MNRIDALFSKKPSEVLNIFFTAGYPSLGDTLPILKALQSGGVDMVEIGMPFSDPLADGPVIQQCSEAALQNGMNLDLLFEQLKGFRTDIKIPVILMGYVNQVLQYGMEKFCKRCAEIGIDGLILPDLPLDEYEHQFLSTFEKYDLKISFLITPRSSEQRIQRIDKLSSAFIYVVSQSSTTGSSSSNEDAQKSYFEKIANLKVSRPKMIGFGISNHQQFARACQYANGAIIGSAFLRAIKDQNDLNGSIQQFIKTIKSDSHDYSTQA